MLDKITTKNVIKILQQSVNRKDELMKDIRAKNIELLQEDVIIKKAVERLIKELDKWEYVSKKKIDKVIPDKGTMYKYMGSE